jgi:hypothetical protein
VLPSASALACRREERVQKAFSVDHHEAGDARLSHSATAVYGAKCDYVRPRGAPSASSPRRTLLPDNRQQRRQSLLERKVAELACNKQQSMKLQHKRSRGKHRNADCASDGDEARKRMQAESGGNDT